MIFSCFHFSLFVAIVSDAFFNVGFSKKMLNLKLHWVDLVHRADLVNRVYLVKRVDLVHRADLVNRVYLVKRVDLVHRADQVNRVYLVKRVDLVHRADLVNRVVVNRVKLGNTCIPGPLVIQVQRVHQIFLYLPVYKFSL